MSNERQINRSKRVKGDTRNKKGKNKITDFWDTEESEAEYRTMHNLMSRSRRNKNV